MGAFRLAMAMVGSCCAEVDFVVVVKEQLDVSIPQLHRVGRETYILVDTEHFKVDWL